MAGIDGATIERAGIGAQVQAALDGAPSDRCGPLLEPVLKPLQAAYRAAASARALR